MNKNLKRFGALICALSIQLGGAGFCRTWTVHADEWPGLSEEDQQLGEEVNARREARKQAEAEAAAPAEDDPFASFNPDEAPVTIIRTEAPEAPVTVVEYTVPKTEYVPQSKTEEAEPAPAPQPVVEPQPAAEPEPTVTAPEQNNVQEPETLYTNYEVATDSTGKEKYYTVKYVTSEDGVKEIRTEMDALPEDAVSYSFDDSDKPVIRGIVDVIRMAVDSYRNTGVKTFEYAKAQAKIDSIRNLALTQLKERIDQDTAIREEEAELARKAAEEEAAHKAAEAPAKEEYTYNFNEFRDWAAPGCLAAKRCYTIKNLQSSTGSVLSDEDAAEVSDKVAEALAEERANYDYYEAYGTTDSATVMQRADLGAAEWAEIMVRSGSFGHADLKGEKGITRLGYRMGSENIAAFYITPDTSVDDIVAEAIALWTGSEAHHENRLDEYWKYYDMAVACSDRVCVVVERFAK